MCEDLLTCLIRISPGSTSFSDLSRGVQEARGLSPAVCTMESVSGSDDSGDKSVSALDEYTVASVSMTVRSDRRPTFTDDADTKVQ